MTQHFRHQESPSDAEPDNPGKTQSNPWQGIVGRKAFFEDPSLASLRQRALTYAKVGLPIHFCGPAGLGKTSMALAVARQLGRPVSMITGHAWLTAGDLIGKQTGQSANTLIDKYVQSVRRSEVRTRPVWQDSVLAAAMEHGHTLIYDEFTRATPRANGILLSVLEEGVLISTDLANDRAYLEAHPGFRILLTSNPHDYAGVNQAPDALLDRMVTFNLAPPPLDTAAGIVETRTGLAPQVARRIVSLVQRLRDPAAPEGDDSLRAAIMIARIFAAQPAPARADDTQLAQIATDVLASRVPDLRPEYVHQAIRDTQPNDPEGPPA